MCSVDRLEASRMTLLRNKQKGRCCFLLRLLITYRFDRLNVQATFELYLLIGDKKRNFEIHESKLIFIVTPNGRHRLRDGQKFSLVRFVSSSYLSEPVRREFISHDVLFLNNIILHFIL